MFNFVKIFCLLLFIQKSTQDLDFVNNSPHQHLIRRDFKFSTNWIDCSERATVLFYYKTQPDTNNYTRSKTFFLDPKVPDTCQQTSTKGYNTEYDRGHLVTANHLDFDKESIKESNYMTNILPQASTLNKGAWEITEEIIECKRDPNQPKNFANLEVIGGIVMGDNTDNDLFVSSHGVKTPEKFWKIVRNLDNGDIIAWMMPNTNKGTDKNHLDDFLTTVADIEEQSGFYFKSITKEQRNKKQNKSWDIPKGCNAS